MPNPPGRRRRTTAGRIRREGATAKIIAAAGICSRRAAEELLRQGRVRVNGQPAALGDQADPESDIVTVDGQPCGGTPAGCT
ncbi:MAG: S4 domain-containing protein [Oscillospiraceae bacterium]